MPGFGTSDQSTQTTSSTKPWDASLPTVNNLFSGVNSLLPNVGTTSAENGAINQLTANGQAGNPYATGIGNTATSLLQGGGAMNYAPNVTQADNTYQGQVQPLASNTNYDPMQTPGLGDQLQALKDSITGSVNGQFAAGGRDFSGMNQKALGTGLTNGLSPIITAQYNANRDAQQQAAQNGFNANNASTGLLTGMQNQSNANQLQGVQAAGNAWNARNQGAQQVLTAQELAKSIPASNLGLLAQIGIPLASLGTNSNGTSDTQSTASPLQMLTSIGGLFGSGAGGTSAAAGMGQAAAGGAAGLSALLGLI
jgi:hypothetical protein